MSKPGDPSETLQLLQKAIHDIANDLNAISMQAELAILLGKEIPALEKPLRRITDACQHAGQLTALAEQAADPSAPHGTLEQLQTLVK